MMNWPAEEDAECAARLQKLKDATQLEGQKV